MAHVADADAADLHAAELDLGGAACDTEHLVDAGTIMYIVVNPVSPGLLPTISLEESSSNAAARSRSLERRTAMRYMMSGQTRMIGNNAIIFEMKAVRHALLQEFDKLVAGRSRPSSQLFGVFLHRL